MKNILTGNGIRDTGPTRLVSPIFLQRGFTPLESALATIIIGVGVLALSN